MSENQYYVMRAVRRTRFTQQEDLVQPVEQLVRAIQSEGPRFQLFGRSPSHALYPLLKGKESNVDKFVMTSDIEWNFGREPQDPTYQVTFYQDPNEESVMLKIQFVLKEDEGTFPGLVAELYLPSDVSGNESAERGARLDRLFSALIEILRPDNASVQLPDHPEGEDWYYTLDFGWLTYLARAVLSVPPPSIATPFADGVKIIAVPDPVPDDHSAVGDAITALRGVIAP
jgi:hypothetical protein